MSDPVWWLLDEDRKLVASTRAPTAIDAKAQFKATAGPKGDGLRGAWVVRGRIAPVEETAVRLVCENPHCQAPIVEDRDYRIVTGWERIQRSAGGTNAIRAPDRTAERFMCMFCIDKLASGVSLDQETLAV